MALIKCSECGKEISSEAEACPSCGKPTGIIHCPVCKSTNISKKSEGQTLISALAGLFVAGPLAKKVEPFTCNNCHHTW